jgi:hypothetical protein
MTLGVNHPQSEAPTALNLGAIHAKVPIQYPGLHVDGALAVSITCRKKRRWAHVRPISIGLLGLALAVVLWGIGYKLSLYRPHPAPAVRAGVAKLWVGPRNSGCLRSSRTKATTPPASNAQLLSAKDSTLPHSIGGALHFSTTAADGSRVRLLLGTLRSPPPRYL